MKKRFVYMWLFLVPSLLAAFLAAAAALGVAAGGLWLFVLGDDPWPAWAGTGLGVVFGLVFLTVSAACLSVAYAVGKQQEARDGFDRRAVLASVGVTLLLVLLLVGHQWRVGNLGPEPPSLVCAEACRAAGYPGSETPPRDSGATDCTCIDATGARIRPPPSPP